MMRSETVWTIPIYVLLGMIIGISMAQQGAGDLTMRIAGTLLLVVMLLDWRASRKDKS